MMLQAWCNVWKLCLKMFLAHFTDEETGPPEGFGIILKVLASMEEMCLHHAHFSSERGTVQCHSKWRSELPWEQRNEGGPWAMTPCN